MVYGYIYYACMSVSKLKRKGIPESKRNGSQRGER